MKYYVLNLTNEGLVKVRDYEQGMVDGIEQYHFDTSNSAKKWLLDNGNEGHAYAVVMADEAFEVEISRKLKKVT